MITPDVPNVKSSADTLTRMLTGMMSPKVDMSQKPVKKLLFFAICGGVIGAAAAACVGYCAYQSYMRRQGESRRGESLQNKPVRPAELTEKDKDLMELIGELAAVYDNTDQYMKH